MRTIQLEYKDIKKFNEPLTLCLGYFDGVHLGHQKLISEAVKSSKYKVGVLTFDKPISSFIDNGKSLEVITSLDDRFKVISRLNADYYFVLHIDKDFLNLSVDDFLSLLEKMNVKEIYVGEDYRFAKDAKGNINDLKKCFKTNVVSLVNENDKKISTQDIVNSLKNGDLVLTKTLLGRNYLISGVVSKGKQLGRTIGYPTMNLKTFSNYVLPKFGVYKTITYLNGVPHNSITNVGIKPTINGSSPTIEVYIPNFSGEVYDENLAVEFIEFIRSEIKFSSLEELKNQIDKDIKKVI